MIWQNEPPYGHPEGSPFEVMYRARCFCGAVELETCADPVDAKLCHCPQCQRLHGAPFQWAVIFHKTDVHFVRGVDNLNFFNGDLMQGERILPCKLTCKTCHAPIADEGRRMFLAFGPLFDFGYPPAVPESFRPSCHIFYGSRVIDILDGKPKYLGHKGHSPLWHED